MKFNMPTKVRITVREQNPIQGVLLATFIMASTAIAFYLWVNPSRSSSSFLATLSMSPVAKMSLLIGGIIFLGFILFYSFLTSDPLIVIDEEGIYDRRLEIGKISWSDIEEVQITGGYGNRLLSVRVREPGQYTKKLHGLHRETVKQRQDLGFSKFNVDLRDVNINLLDLKELIVRRISK